MKRIGLHGFFACISLALLFYVVVIRLRFTVLPVFFLALGLASYAWNGRKALRLFLFLLPWVGATPGLFFNGYPFNYMGIPLFYLSGILCAALLNGERPACNFPGRVFYLLFLSLLGISVFFVFLRWSNLGLPALAFLRDTPVAPSGERVSFACIFPVVTLALFTLAPFLVFLVRLHHLSEGEIFVPLQAGFCLSFLMALAQKWLDPGFLSQSWWGRKLSQVNGGFSDFNAFGFFAGTLLLYQALKLIGRLPLQKKEAVVNGGGKGSVTGGGRDVVAVWGGILFLGIALAAIFISGCRTAFLFVLAAMVALVLSRKVGLAVKAGVVLLLASLLVIGGGTLGKRLQQTVARATRISSAAGLYRAVDEISNRRLQMLRDGAQMTGRFPVSGVGAGNFLFYLKYLRFGEKDYLDLPLNQYLLFFSETGLAGGLAFVFFLAALIWRQKPGAVRFMLAGMAIALLFNNFFWFPECLLLFWIFVARAEAAPPPASHRALAWGAAVALLFIAMNIVDFTPLHPAAWAREMGTPYDYGFSYRENEDGRVFRWSGEKAGRTMQLGRQGKVAEFILTCGAPLDRLPGKKQTVEVFWRGEPYRRIVFRENTSLHLRIADRLHDEGFLEFRVRPGFNLKRMGLGAESRDLGVQVSGPER